jgi:hypothetical protein
MHPLGVTIMEKETTDTIPTPDSVLRELAKLEERKGWAHHVADAATGELLTTQLPQPITPLSRLERLSRLGHQFDVPILGAPTHRLTPRYPYQASPRGGLTFGNAFWVSTEAWDYTQGIAIWSFATLGRLEEEGALHAQLGDLPNSRCLVTLRFSTEVQAGHDVGSVRILVKVEGHVIASFQLAVHGSGAVTEHIFDFVLVPPRPAFNIDMILEPRSGLYTLTFTSLTVTPDLVVHP